MRKAVIVGVLAVVIVAVWGLLALGGANFLARLALEHWGPRMTGTSVDVEYVRLPLFKGEGLVQGLELGGPAGFKARTAHLGRELVGVEAREELTGGDAIVVVDQHFHDLA